MFGFYENFPANVHKILLFTSTVSNRKLQNAIIQALHRLNSQNQSIEKALNLPVLGSIAIFEFGIAEGEAFNYIDAEEAQKALEKIQKTPFQVMDLFCAVRYYKKTNGKSKPLKFDYYMLRLTFNTGLLEAQVFHERGPRHMAAEDIINMLVAKVNELFPRRTLKKA